MDKDRLRALFKAAAAIRMIRLQQFQSIQPTLSDVGGEHIRSLALRVSKSGNQKAQEFAARAVEVAKSNEVSYIIATADIGLLVEGDLVQAMLGIERDLIEVYKAAFKHGISPLNNP